MPSPEPEALALLLRDGSHRLLPVAVERPDAALGLLPAGVGGWIVLLRGKRLSIAPPAVRVIHPVGRVWDGGLVIALAAFRQKHSEHVRAVMGADLERKRRMERMRHAAD